ncbi:MAG: hypothetical protein M3Z92_00755 [Bacteroidota bacterium]|nr:hypothetical protein [Bacteroidota bacterium]
MTKVLITGNTGSVGTEVLISLNKLDHHLDVYAGVRDMKELTIKEGNKIKCIEFD